MSATDALPAQQFPDQRQAWSSSERVPPRRLSSNLSPAPLPGLPGGIHELEQHFDKHELSPQARRIVHQIVTGPPVRRVGGGARNAVLRYASRKMGCVVQAESRTVEGAFVQYCEFSPHVVFYFCQPWTLSVPVIDVNGRRLPIHTTVDFLVLDSRGFRFIECKDIGEVRRLSECKYPRFVRDDDGHWRWTAAEQAAGALGLGFELFTSEAINPIWLRNMRFLADYMDVPPPPDSPPLASFMARLKQEGSIPLSQIFTSDEISPSVLWWLVAQRRVWCDVAHERLFETDQAWVHHSEPRMLAHRRSYCSVPASPQSTSAGPIILEPGSQLSWDHVPWTVLNRGAKSVTLQRASGSGLATLPLAEADNLIRTGAWRGDGSALQDARADLRTRILRRATDRDLAEALRRSRVVEHFHKHRLYPPGVVARVARRYVRWYRDGEQRYGSEFCGLIRFRGRPPGIPRLPKRQREVLEEVLAAFATNEKAGRVCAAYSRVVELCRERGITPPPSEETVRRRLKQHSIPDDERIRKGSRAAYQAQGPLPETAATPRHGDRAWGSRPYRPHPARYSTRFLQDAYASRHPLAHDLHRRLLAHAAGLRPFI